MIQIRRSGCSCLLISATVREYGVNASTEGPQTTLIGWLLYLPMTQVGHLRRQIRLCRACYTALGPETGQTLVQQLQTSVHTDTVESEGIGTRGWISPRSNRVGERSWDNHELGVVSLVLQRGAGGRARVMDGIFRLFTRSHGRALG